MEKNFREMKSEDHQQVLILFKKLQYKGEYLDWSTSPPEWKEASIIEKQ